MIYSEEEIITYIQLKIQEQCLQKRQNPDFELFLSEEELFVELGAETSEEKQLITMIASSAVDGFNYGSNIKFKTDIDVSEMEKAERFSKKYIRPSIQLQNIYYKKSDASKWFEQNILSSGYNRNPNLPGRSGTLFYFLFFIVIAFLDLGSSWWEITLKSLGFIFALTTGFIIYSIITDLVARNDIPFKKFIHFILLLIFPLIVYACVKIYFL